jgi:uncharacterized membrane protein YqjE
MGLLDSVQTLLSGGLSLARTRLELFGTELQEELARLLFALLCAVSVVLLGAIAAMFFGLALIISIAPESRSLAAGLIGVVFIALASVAAWQMGRASRPGARPFDASLNELERDYEALRP